jgi:hypothetical protein
MSKTQRIFKRSFLGIISAGIHFSTKILLPMYIFTSLVGFTIVGINLGYTQEKVDYIIYYIFAFGIISTALSFFKASSPKHSIRKPVAEFLFLFVSMCYLYTYRLSGAFNFQNITIPINSSITTQFSLNLDNMIYVSMAIISLKMIIALGDIIKASFFPKTSENDTKFNNTGTKVKKVKMKKQKPRYKDDLEDLLGD